MLSMLATSAIWQLSSHATAEMLTLARMASAHSCSESFAAMLITRKLLAGAGK